MQDDEYKTISVCSWKGFFLLSIKTPASSGQQQTIIQPGLTASGSLQQKESSGKLKIQGGPVKTEQHVYTERQKKLITSSGRRSLKSTLSKLIVFGHK